MIITFKLADECVACGGKNLEAQPAHIAPFIVHRMTGRKMTLIPCHTLKCLDCETTFLDIRYNDKQLMAIYHGYRNKLYVDNRELYEDGYREMNAWFSRRVPYMDEVEEKIRPFVALPVSVLDWGGDTGINAPFENDRTLLHVYDIGTNPVVPGAMRVDFPDAMTYDLVVCANVLEHVPFPADTLREVVLCMDVESVLYLEVPAKDDDQYWHEHINRFSGAGLDALVDRCGLVTLFGGLAKVKINDRFILQYMMVCKRKD